MAHPPVPKRAVDQRGTVVYTANDISEGQQVFLHNGLMEYGSVFGHGAYLVPDFTDDYLHRAALSVRRQLGGAASDTARTQVIRAFQTNRYDSATGTLAFTREQARAFVENEAYYRQYFGDPETDKGLRPEAITDRRQIHQLTSFFAWTSWAASARRPGKDYSYT